MGEGRSGCAELSVSESVPRIAEPSLPKLTSVEGKRERCAQERRISIMVSGCGSPSSVTAPLSRKCRQCSLFDCTKSISSTSVGLRRSSSRKIRVISEISFGDSAMDHARLIYGAAPRCRPRARSPSRLRPERRSPALLQEAPTWRRTAAAPRTPTPSFRRAGSLCVRQEQREKDTSPRRGRWAPNNGSSTACSSRCDERS